MNHHITPGKAMFDLNSPTALDDLRGGDRGVLYWQPTARGLAVAGLAGCGR